MVQYSTSNDDDDVDSGSYGDDNDGDDNGNDDDGYDGESNHIDGDNGSDDDHIHGSSFGIRMLMMVTLSC